MSNDLISRQDAIDALDCINGVEEVLRSIPSAQPKTVCVAKITLSDEQIQKVVEKIKNEAIQVFPSAQPTIEPRAKPKTGEWKEHIFNGVMGSRPRALMCTQCNRISLYAYNFCPPTVEQK